MICTCVRNYEGELSNLVGNGWKKVDRVDGKVTYLNELLRQLYVSWMA